MTNNPKKTPRQTPTTPLTPPVFGNLGVSSVVGVGYSTAGAATLLARSVVLWMLCLRSDALWRKHQAIFGEGFRREGMTLSVTAAIHPQMYV